MIAQKTRAFIRNPGGSCRQNPFFRLTYRALVRLLFFYKCRSGLKHFKIRNTKSFPAFHEGYSRINSSKAEQYFPKYKEFIQESHRIPTDVSDMKPRDKSGGFYAIDPKDTEVFNQFPALVNLALSDELLSGVASYLGEPPILTYLSCWHTRAHTASPSTSELYHLDHEAEKQVKVFIYLSEVSEENGPLTLVNAEHTDTLCKKINYEKHRRENHHMPDDIARQHIKPEIETVLNASFGDVVFVDTSRCLHFGGRVKKGIRRVIVMQFMPRDNYVINPLLGKKLYPYSNFAGQYKSVREKLVLTG